MPTEIVSGSGKTKGHIVLGKQLRLARETVKFHPEEVAGRLGVQRNEILDWEAERTKPRLPQLENLAKLYGREIDYFLKETHRPPGQIQFRSATGRGFSDLSEKARVVIARFDELCRTALELERR